MLINIHKVLILCIYFIILRKYFFVKVHPVQFIFLYSMSIHETIKTLRMQAGISQEQMADLLSMSRITYTHIESGKRELKTSEIEKIAQFFEITPMELMQTASVSKKIEIRGPQTKMMNVILYILSKCAGKPNLGKIVMNKLLYFIDFNYHEKYHESLTGTTYVKMPMGPVPKDGEELLQQMKEEWLIDIVQGEYFWYMQTRLIPKAAPNMQQLTVAQLTEIDYVINQYGDKTGKRLTEFSHGDVPRKLTPKIGDEISYNFAHYRDSLYRVTTDEEDGD